MEAIKRIFGYVHIAMALIVAVQFLASPMYGGGLNGEIWDAVSIMMAVGVVAALVFAAMRMREESASGDSGSRIMLIATIALFLLFFRLFFSSQVFDSNEKPPYEFRLLMWYGIDVLFVIVSLFMGRYLMRGSNAGN